MCGVTALVESPHFGGVDLGVRGSRVAAAVEIAAVGARGVVSPDQDRGRRWENRIELNKKLTETLSVAIRHETRRNNPDVRIEDYTLLRLLVGLDF